MFVTIQKLAAFLLKVWVCLHELESCLASSLTGIASE